MDNKERMKNELAKKLALALAIIVSCVVACNGVRWILDWYYGPTGESGGLFLCTLAGLAVGIFCGHSVLAKNAGVKESGSLFTTLLLTLILVFAFGAIAAFVGYTIGQGISRAMSVIFAVAGGLLGAVAGYIMGIGTYENL